MIWKIGEAKGSGIDYIGYAQTTPISAATREHWLKYLKDAAPLNADVSSDHLRVEIWLDSGRIILFPSPSPFRYRVEKAMCEIICPDLLVSYEETAASNLSDDEFDSWANQAIEKVAGLVSESAKDVKLPERLGRPEVRIRYFASAGESGPLKEEVLRREK
jgi:hypothetical protein